MGARRTANFIVETDDPNFAQQVSQAAEQYRHDWPISWLGEAMPNWSQPCVMTVQPPRNSAPVGPRRSVSRMARCSSGGCRFKVRRARARFRVAARNHAHDLRQPLSPAAARWADEGGATSVEYASEKNKYRQMLDQSLRTGRGIAFNRMFAMMDYPPDYNGAVRPGLFAGRVLDLRGRAADVRRVSRRWAQGRRLHGRPSTPLRREESWIAAKHLACMGAEGRAAGTARRSAADALADRQRPPATARAESDLPHPRQAAAASVTAGTWPVRAAGSGS